MGTFAPVRPEFARAGNQSPFARRHDPSITIKSYSRSRNLYWGFGGEKHQPVPPVEFVGEDLNGTNPKFDVRDSNDKKWRVKLGSEAQPEVGASRLLWAVGYTTNEDYFVRQLQVRKMPARLHRGQKLVGRGGTVLNVRLQRHPEHEKKVGDWNWRHNPFYGTREFNGLRVMMALIRNWVRLVMSTLVLLPMLLLAR